MIISENDARLLARAAASSTSRSDLAEVTGGEGIDFATARLYDCLIRVPANADFLSSVLRAPKPAKVCADLIGIVPGAFHGEHRHTGADGARVLALARESNCDAELVPTASFGTLDENAGIILKWLVSKRGRRVVLVSLSKGGSDVKKALSQPEAAVAFAPVSTWLSLSGLVHGTPLVDWLRRRPLLWWGVRAQLWWRGHRVQALEDLRHGPGTALAEWPALPPHLRVIHVCAFPLEHHLTHPWAPRAYRRLAPLGPNDGGAIHLRDFLDAPGVVCPIWGVDHYLAPSWDILPLLRGIFAVAMGDLANETGMELNR